MQPLHLHLGHVADAFILKYNTYNKYISHKKMKKYILLTVQ